jgi:hypothetical protein
MASRILRYEVPVDGDDHEAALSGAVLHVGARRRDVVEFWALSTGGPEIPRYFRVFGTGQEIGPGVYRYVGTVTVPTGDLVWHLMERP